MQQQTHNTSAKGPAITSRGFEGINNSLNMQNMLINENL